MLCGPRVTHGGLGEPRRTRRVYVARCPAVGERTAASRGRVPLVWQRIRCRSACGVAGVLRCRRCLAVSQCLWFRSACGFAGSCGAAPGVADVACQYPIRSGPVISVPPGILIQSAPWWNLQRITFRRQYQRGVGLRHRRGPGGFPGRAGVSRVSDPIGRPRRRRPTGGRLPGSHPRSPPNTPAAVRVGRRTAGSRCP